MMTRSASLVPSTLDTENRTVGLTWTTGARVLRGMFDPYLEELSLDPAHVRMGRLQSGSAPLLDSHNATGIDSIIGIVEAATLDKTRGTGTVRFDSGPRGEDAMRRVAEGTLRGVSVGYRVYKLTQVEAGDTTTPVYRAIDWEPHELSLTPIGADAGATVRSQKDPSMSIKSRPNTPNTTPAEIADLVDEPQTRGLGDALDPMTAERERSAAISRISRTLSRGFDIAGSVALERLGDDLIREGASLDVARARLLDECAERGTITISRRSTESTIGAGRDHDQTRLELMAEALAGRFGGPAPGDEARQYSRLSTVDSARHFLEARGVNTRTMAKGQIVERSLHATSDFPNLLTSTGSRLLRAGYASYTGGLQQACKQGSARDFRAIQKIQLGNPGTLEKVNEGGEYTRTTMAEAKEAYSLATFGKIFGISRAALINDDLGAFADMTVRLGRHASEFVASELVKLLVANPTLGVDGLAVFHATHGNLAGAGTVISTTSLGTALKSMRLQKGLDGKTAIDVSPKFLIVPAALETVALQTIAAITPAQTSNVNPFAGKLEAIVDPRLDASSATRWYLAADPAVVDTIEYSYLDGANGPEVILREGFDVDGVEWKVRLDFGAGILDWRGLYMNPGA